MITYRVEYDYTRGPNTCSNEFSCDTLEGAREVSEHLKRVHKGRNLRFTIYKVERLERYDEVVA